MRLFRPGSTRHIAANCWLGTGMDESDDDDNDNNDTMQCYEIFIWNRPCKLCWWFELKWK